jgi:hypothetical protein
VVALREFLDESIEIPQEYWKLACKYDWLVFGPGFTGDRTELHQSLGLVPPVSVEKT